MYLLDAISGDVEKGRPVVVFCNKNSTSQFVSHFLKGRNIRCVTLNKDTDTHERRKNIRKFLSGDVNVLSCTDLVRHSISMFRMCWSDLVVLELVLSYCISN